MKLKTKFQDEDFELGEVVDIAFSTESDDYIQIWAITKRGRLHPYFYKPKSKFNAEWEDVPEEPKEYWRITDLGELKSIRLDQHHQNIEKCKQIGNYFSSREEAEKALDKLKAFKRLEDKGFRFEGIKQDYTRFNQQEPMRTGRKYLQFNKSEDEDWLKENWEYLSTCFGGEE